VDFDETYKIAVGILKISPSEFWELTYSEIYTLSESYIEQKNRDYTEKLNVGVHTAWAFISMSSDIQRGEIKLKNYLYGEKQAEPQGETDLDALVAALRMWNAGMGGKEIIN
jgi:hypothetical protein